MKKYLQPEIDTVELAKEDIMALSGGELGDGGSMGDKEMPEGNT